MRANRPLPRRRRGRTTEGQKALYGAALAAAGLRLWELDPGTGRVVWHNTPVVGADANESDLAALLRMVHSDDRAVLEGAFTSAAAQGSPIDAEFRTVRPDGDVRWHLIRGQRHAVDPGEPMRLVGVTGDITKRKLQEVAQAAHIEAERRATAEAASAARRQTQLEMLAAVGLSSLGLEELLERMLDLVRQRLGADTATLLLRNERRDRLAVRASQGITVEITSGIEIPIGQGIAGRVAASGEPIVVGDITEVEVYSQYLRDSGVRGLAAVPLVVESRTIGVLHVGSFTAGHFGPDDLELLQLVADRVALAVDRATTYERARDIAETLQRSLLPDQLPEVPGIELAARYIAGDSDTLVGGDWYDAIPTVDGRIMIVIGDAMGHGPRAAALMGRLRNEARLALARGNSPADLTTRLNRLASSLDETQLATMACLLIDPGTGNICVANAGHPPPIVRQPDGETVLISDPLGPPLGATSRHYDEASIRVPIGSVVLLYTDGLIERRGTTLEAGIDRVKSIMTEAGDSTAVLCDRLLEVAAGSPEAPDDIAFLAVRLVASVTQPLTLSVPADVGAPGIVRASLRQWLDEAGAPTALADELVIAASEAASNVVRHAYVQPGGVVEVSATRLMDTLMVAVRDYGQWRPPATADQGRGLLLMESLVDELTIDHRSDGTAVQLIRKLPDR